MIAYNITLLNNIAIVKKAKQWYANKLISTDQMGIILKKYPIDYFKPNLFVRIGLFIFTLFLISAALSIFSLFVFSFFANFNNSDTTDSIGVIASIVFAGLTAFFHEKFIKWRNWYSNGIDNALLYSSLGFTVSVLAFGLSNNLNADDRLMILYTIMLPILFFAMIRYIDRIVAVLFTLCLYTVFFYTIMKLGSIAKLIMPFAFMILSGVIYFFVNREIKKDSSLHLRKCLTVINTIALIIFYASGNYYVIRECSVEFFYMNIAPGEDIPLAIVFYLFTAIVPIVYLYFGLKKKDKLRLWVSLVLIVSAVLTFKYYFSLGHPEITLTLAGIVMVLVAYFSIKYLKEDKNGITFKLDPDEDNFLKTNAEALLIAQSFGGLAQSGDQSGVEMGGGKFGGAGSGGNY